MIQYAEMKGDGNSRSRWRLGCGVAFATLILAVAWMAFEAWGVYRGEMVWLVAVHRARFIAANGRAPFDGREMNIWFGRQIGNGDRLPPMYFEGGLFNCGNRDARSLEDMTRFRVSLMESAASLGSRLDLMGISGKSGLKALVEGFKDGRNPFAVRYDMLRDIVVYLILAGKDGGDGVSAEERRAALDALRDAAKDEASPFCGIALYGLARNAAGEEREKLRDRLRQIANSPNACPIGKAAADYLLREGR